MGTLLGLKRSTSGGDVFIGISGSRTHSKVNLQMDSRKISFLENHNMEMNHTQHQFRNRRQVAATLFSRLVPKSEYGCVCMLRKCLGYKVECERQYALCPSLVPGGHVPGKNFYLAANLLISIPARFNGIIQNTSMKKHRLTITSEYTMTVLVVELPCIL
ncbi:hypothetical protein VKT23_007353 [Stygiomarasmius scandens]|uniref:Uncharacterized protein n=1 Tax=Marasmiellus scandens TaxID=2682957 RepID=A0ABR1JM62_9AGAR